MKTKMAYIAYRYQPSRYLGEELEVDWVIFRNRKIRDAFAEKYGLQKNDILLEVDERPKRKKE
jgi:hypothetical protein